jgi:hypothetical protein
MAPQLSDFSGIIPHEYSQQVIQEVEQRSAVLQLAQTMPMGTRITELPVTGKLPAAQWVTGAAAPPAGPGRKPYTDLTLVPQVITAEEIAAVVAIPQQYLDDNTINLWNWARPKMAEAIAIRLDQTVLFGGAGIPATFPVGGVTGPLYSMGVGGGGVVGPGNPFPFAIDAVDAVNNAMSYVEGQGLNVTGHSADIGAKGQFRGVRDKNGSLLLGTEQVGQVTRPTIYGVPVAYSQYAAINAVDFITGAWDYLVIGVREDIRFRIDPSGTIADDAGKVLVSGFQDNVVPCKIWARFGCTIIKPVTPRVPAGAIPFAKTRLLGLVAPDPPAGEAGERSSAKKAA